MAQIFPSNVDKKSYDGQQPVRLCNYTDVYYNERITADLELMAATATPEQVERFTLRANDVLITKDSETADDIAVAAFVPADMPGSFADTTWPWCDRTLAFAVTSRSASSTHDSPERSSV
ncbi:MAG: hypothetical protein IPK12_08155 [Gemmatimonadetes bacterium]|nr:hypothetical protein [Gemmatimonadota bacterium]